MMTPQWENKTRRRIINVDRAITGLRALSGQQNGTAQALVLLPLEVTRFSGGSGTPVVISDSLSK
jgi:hypothetical protein